MTFFRRPSIGMLVGGALGALLAGCVQHERADPAPTRTGSTADAETAKQQMIDAVEDATERFGGEWTTRTGPDYPEDCSLPDSRNGAHRVYLVDRVVWGDTESDAAMLQRVWEERGMRTARWGADGRSMVVGRGGDQVSSISIHALPVKYSIEAVSLCFPEDADAISETIAEGERHSPEEW